MAGEITMLDSPSRADLIRASKAIAVITSEPLDDVSIAQIIVTDPHAAFSTAVQYFRPTIQKKALGNGISEQLGSAILLRSIPPQSLGMALKLASERGFSRAW